MAQRVKELSGQLNLLQVQHEQLMQRNKLLEMALGSGQEQRNRPSSLDIKREVCPASPHSFQVARQARRSCSARACMDRHAS